jgi:hypothetical protein
LIAQTANDPPPQNTNNTSESPEETMLARNREALLRQTEKAYLLKLQDWTRE